MGFELIIVFFFVFLFFFVIVVFLFFFFFSSRRRHTRWPRDWSSDACSSDLEAGQYRFTSALAVSLLKALAPELQPLLGPAADQSTQRAQVGQVDACSFNPIATYSPAALGGASPVPGASSAQRCSAS